MSNGMRGNTSKYKLLYKMIEISERKNFFSYFLETWVVYKKFEFHTDLSIYRPIDIKEF